MPLILQAALAIYTQALFCHLLARLLQKRYADLSFAICGALGTTLVTHRQFDVPVAVLLGASIAVGVLSHFAILAMLRRFWPLPRQTT
jgi:hypothetical protein